MANLSSKQRAFVEHYLQCWNATEAARLAQYAHPNQQGSRLLANVGIAAEVERRLTELKLGANEVLVRLAQQARAEYAAYLGPDGTVNLRGMIADGKAHLVKGTKWDRNGNLTVEFYDAHAALVDIGKALGLFQDRLQVTGALEIPGLDAALERVYGDNPA